VTSLIFEDENRQDLLNSILNSVVDIDKIDYLIRDSVHCGVNYGMGIDIDRLVDALYVNEKGDSICLTIKVGRLLFPL